MRRTQNAEILRVIDANLNRAREGLRVCEEIARLILEDPRLTRRCQALRQELNRLVKSFSNLKLLQARNSRGDVGRPAVRGRMSLHRGYRDLATANARRVEEALRVLEEFLRLRSPRVSQRLGSLRFRVYALEQDLLRKLPALRHR